MSKAKKEKKARAEMGGNPAPVEKPEKAKKARKKAEVKPGKGKGLDYSRAPGGREEFFLFVDEAGRLCYSARGKSSLVSLVPLGKAAYGDDEDD